jgi:hypothetical protein
LKNKYPPNTLEGKVVRKSRFLVLKDRQEFTDLPDVKVRLEK